MSERAAEKDAQPRPARARRIVVGLLVVLSAAGVVGSTVAVWADRLLFNTDRWVDTVRPLLGEPAVNAALSSRLADSIMEALDVQDRVEGALERERLPDAAALLARPVSEATRDRIRSLTARLLRSEPVERLWVAANRVAHQAVVAILRDESETVTLAGDEVTLNLAPIMSRALSAVEDQLSALRGRSTSVPEIAETVSPDAAREQLSDALGVQLPPGFGELVVYRSDRLESAQDFVRFLDRVVVVIPLVTLALIVGALLLSLNRRRTAVQLGVAILIGLLLARRVIGRLRDNVASLADNPTGQGALRETFDTVVSFLFTLTSLLLVAAIVLAVVAFVTGRRAWIRGIGRGVRGAAAWLERDRPWLRWAAEHSDGIRLVGVGAAIGALFALDLTWGVVAVVLALLAAYELGLSYLFSARAGPSEPRAQGPD